MTTVFMAGSRDISRLNADIRGRLSNIISNRFDIIVGDANGADKALQKFLFDINYENVIVYCSGLTCRNNVGAWKTFYVDVDKKFKGRDFYTQKDIKMAEDADYGFMLWDGKSLGTVSNIVELVKRGKKALVYFSPEHSFYPVLTAEQAKEIIKKSSDESLRSISSKIDTSSNDSSANLQAVLDF